MGTGRHRADSQLRAHVHAVRPLLAELAGSVAVQFGAPGHDCLARERFGAVFHLDVGGDNADGRARVSALPLPSAMLDVLVLVQVLENSRDRAAVMREAARVLRGEGRLVVVGRRPLSPAGFVEWAHGLRGGMVAAAPWNLRSLMSANGILWQGRRRAGAAYVATGLRRSNCMTPLRPDWRSRRAAPASVGVPGAGHAG